MAVGAFLRLAVQVAAAVADIHGRGLIHKDLKPGNILFDPETGEVKIADFGTASRVAREQTTARPARLIEGSLPYVSPEQTGRMNRAVDSRSDLYSLGVTFYQLLTGRCPSRPATPSAGCTATWPAAAPAGRAPPRRCPPSSRTSCSSCWPRCPTTATRARPACSTIWSAACSEWRETGAVGSVPARRAGRLRSFPDPAEALWPARGVRRLAASVRARGRHRRPGARAGLRATRASASRRSCTSSTEPIVASGMASSSRASSSSTSATSPTSPSSRRSASWCSTSWPRARTASQAGGSGSRRRSGTNGQLIVDLIPQVELVIGPQPPVPELPLEEAENRLRSVVLQFVGAFAGQEHPLTVFLDDLQWADAASLKLLADLVARPEARHLLLIGAYRDNEVGPVPSAEARARRGAQAPARGPRPGARSALRAGRWRSSWPTPSIARAARRAPLASLVRRQDRRQPVLRHPVPDGAAPERADHVRRGAPAAGAGTWPASVAQGFTDNVVELMVGKLRALPPETQEALRAGRLPRRQRGCRHARPSSSQPRSPAPRFEPRSRKTCSCASTRPIASRTTGSRRRPTRSSPRAHGRRCTCGSAGGSWRARRPSAVEERVFDIVEPARPGRPLDRRREKSGSALPSSTCSPASAPRLRRPMPRRSSIFTAGAALLTQDCWDRRYELTFALEFQRAECEFLTGDLEAAEQRLLELSRRVRDIVDVAAVACLRGSPCTRAQIGATSASRPASSTSAGSASIGHRTRRTRRSGRSTSRSGGSSATARSRRSCDLPPMTDPRCRATIDVLNASQGAALFTDENLLCLLVGRMANLSLEHGNTDASCLAYVWLGKTAGRALRRLPDGVPLRQARLRSGGEARDSFASKPAST